MQRRYFLRQAGLATAGLALGGSSRRAVAADPHPWRTFEVVTRVEVRDPSGLTRVWVPTPLGVDTPYQRSLGDTFEVSGGTARLLAGRTLDAVGMVAAEFPSGRRGVLTVTSRVSVRDHAVDVDSLGDAPPRDRALLGHFLRPTALLPIHGAVRAKARAIIRSAYTDADRARAIYDWVVENTVHDPRVRGCGAGNVRRMVEANELFGKCADINALYVALARAGGVPARDVYGLRVAPSRGYESLGPSSSRVTRSQHCRAEVYVDSHGWVPVDPADVRKVAREEPPGPRPLEDPLVQGARARFFGSWEMNWIAYNFGHDVRLPGSRSGPLGFLMFPQAETDQGLLDSLDPDLFRYEITARPA
ncbi:MAG TPA: transglutaminase-like domain-containing protein [Vicinamibacteria bacterium]|nr:transglutaminase-like domain-containing protein [Vicinamibacteria bacterium]